jgi:hypothetical protein
MENTTHTTWNMQSFIAVFCRIEIDTDLSLEVLNFFIFRAEIKGGYSCG